MKYKISFIVLFFMKMNFCNVAEVVKPLPTNEQYARSLAHALLAEKHSTQKSVEEQKNATAVREETFQQWKRVHPDISDEERYRQAAEVLEKENAAAKVAVDCHKKRFSNFAPGGFQIYENFNKPGSFASYMLSFMGGAAALCTFLLMTVSPKKS